MFLSKITRLTAFASVFFLVACGGGGSDSPASNSKTPTATPPAPVNQEQVSVKYDAVKGLYDTSLGENKQYYYIGGDGVLTAYNYLGDGADAGDNCYRESIAGETNGTISGVQVEALDSGDFSIAVGASNVVLRMSGNEVIKLTTTGMSAGGILSLKLNGHLIHLTGKRATDVTIDDILGMLCQ